MRNIIWFLCCLMICTASAQKNDSLKIYYFDDFPYAYTEGGKPRGLEIDMIQEYVKWLKEKKNLSVTVSYRSFKEFGTFYSEVKNAGPDVIGLGSVTWSARRESEVSFSPPYLQNVAVLVSGGGVPTVKQRSADEVNAVLGKLTAVAVSKSSHNSYLNEIKEKYAPGMAVVDVGSQQEVLEKVASDSKSFGYVDIISFWAYIKSNPGKFVKMHKVMSEPKEVFGFIMPKTSVHSSLISEFFESGFGFTSTKVYRQILERYLGHEIIDDVEVK